MNNVYNNLKLKTQQKSFKVIRKLSPNYPIQFKPD
jgi:hypothetical protein